MPPQSLIVAAPAPSTPLGPVLDSAITWTTWVTLMGFVGVLTLSLLAAGPSAAKFGPKLSSRVSSRLTRTSFALGLLAIPAVLTDLAHDASESGGYDYGSAWSSLYDGSGEGLLLGLELTLLVVGLVLLAPLLTGRTSRWLLTGAMVASAISLATTKLPTEVPAVWSRDMFDTVMWLLHLLGGAVWIGGLIGLLALALPSVVDAEHRSVFWAATIRRFSISAMTCVAAIALSGLWLYWEHVDGPSQLFTTMYGRVLGVKILIFGTMALLGGVNQFWLHPKIDALRAAGDERPLRTILVRQFPVVIAVEVVLGLGVLMAAPFLHGSARNQAFQASQAAQAPAGAKLKKIAAKQVSTSTWLYGTGETVVVIAVMVGGFAISGRIAHRRSAAATASSVPVLETV